MSDSVKFNEILEILLIEKKFELHDFMLEMIELIDPDYNTESSDSDEDFDEINESIEVNIDNNGFYYLD